MGDYATIRNGIVGVVQGVAGVHVPVLAYQPLTDNVDAFVALFKTTDPTPQFHGWYVTVLPNRPMGAPLGGNGAGGAMGSIARDYSFTAKGVYLVNNAAGTEATFLTEVEGILQALDAVKYYGDASVIDYSIESWLEVFDMRQFGTPVCHHAELRIKASIQRTVTYA